MSTPHIDTLREQLQRHRVRKPLLRPLMKRSSVAIVLREHGDDTQVLMIKRAEREGDPWSGHMAFPGGRRDPTDKNGFEVALRETREEVGLALTPDDHCLGRLSDINARPSRRVLGMAVSAFVFHLQRDVKFVPNYEVAEVVWIPLSFLLDTANRERMVWERGNIKLPLPCYFYEGKRIWGLSLAMLDELMDVLEGPNAARAQWR